MDDSNVTPYQTHVYTVLYLVLNKPESLRCNFGEYRDPVSACDQVIAKSTATYSAAFYLTNERVPMPSVYGTLTEIAVVRLRRCLMLRHSFLKNVSRPHIRPVYEILFLNPPFLMVILLGVNCHCWDRLSLHLARSLQSETLV